MKVVRDVITCGFGDGSGQPGPICPQRPSTGFYPGGHGAIPGARPGLVPGSWVGPTLVFPGVLNPGIPSMIPLSNNIVNFQGTQVQIASSNDNAGSCC